MGMSASQMRFLMLTARKTDVEFQGQQVNQQRTNLAQESSDLYNTLLNMKAPAVTSFANIENKTMYSGMYYWAGDQNGNNAADADELAKWDGKDVYSRYTYDESTKKSTDLAAPYQLALNNAVQSGDPIAIADARQALSEALDPTNANTVMVRTAEPEDWQVFQDYGQTDSAGNIVASSTNGGDPGNTTNDFYEIALAKYNQKYDQINLEITKIQQEDKGLEIRLKNHDTQHSAIQTEMEAVKKVIDKNIEGSFKTFA